MKGKRDFGVQRPLPEIDAKLQVYALQTRIMDQLMGPRSQPDEAHASGTIDWSRASVCQAL
jgi:hypothetical protein